MSFVSGSPFYPFIDPSISLLSVYSTLLCQSVSSESACNTLLYLYQPRILQYSNPSAPERNQTPSLLRSHRATTTEENQTQIDNPSLPIHTTIPQAAPFTLPPETMHSTTISSSSSSPTINPTRPSMAGWWVCCSCGQENNPAFQMNRCTICGHGQCLSCKKLG